MVKLRAVAPLIGIVVLLAACQLPGGPGASNLGFRLTLNLTAPSAGSSGSDGRLLLDNANRVFLTITDAEGRVQNESASITAATVQFQLKLRAGQTYTFKASARDALGTELFAGQTAPFLFSVGSSMVLHLSPVQAATGTVLASAQTATGSLGTAAQVPILAPDEMATFLGDFETTGTLFTFNDPAPLELYVQRTTGEAVVLTGFTLAKSDLQGNSSFRATFRNPAGGPSSAIAAFGAFTIPMQSFGLQGPTVIDVGEVAAYTVGSIVPANASSVSVTLSTGGTSFSASALSVTGVSPGTALLEATDSNGAVGSLNLTVVERVVYNDGGAPWAQQSWGVPFQTTALAGTSEALWALTGGQKVYQFAAGLWSNSVADPTLLGAQWLAADGQSLWVASTTSIDRFDGSTWAPLTLAPSGVTITGIAQVDGLLWASATDGFLYSWNGVWTKGPALPTGFVALGGSAQLLASTATDVRQFDGNQWTLGPTALPFTQAITQAFNARYVLVVR